jgi:hypothetical protein
MGLAVYICRHLLQEVYTVRSKYFKQRDAIVGEEVEVIVRCAGGYLRQILDKLGYAYKAVK